MTAHPANVFQFDVVKSQSKCHFRRDPAEHSQPIGTNPLHGNYGQCMRVDVMNAPLPLRQMGHAARHAASAGYSSMVLTEGGRTGFLAATAGALSAPELELSTGIAVAFPRSPMVTAQSAWELQEATGGNFRLGDIAAWSLNRPNA
jgi:alkanesulfonate monooxygenase SsuD/methylene tetrahydromethanopterin reductase-like flavin-dependent oxidoreductase (luciferase family)